MSRKVSLLGAVLLAAMCAGTTAVARDTMAAEEDQASPEIEAIFAKIPEKLFNATGTRSAGDSVKSFFPEDIRRDPMASVSVISVAGVSEANWRKHVHGLFNLTTVVREGTFTSPRMAGATGYFGEYMTATGLKQSWMIEQNGIRIAVLVTLLNGSASARRDAVREIAEKIYQGQVMVAEEGPLPKLPLTQRQQQ